MRRLLALTLVLAGSLILVPSAGAIIQVQRAISGVALNMTQAQVRAGLGTPSRTVHGRNDFSQFTELRYPGGITVSFQGNARVTAVSETGPGDRTSNGVGVGSTEAEVRSRVPGVRCATQFGIRTCQVGQSLAGRRVTAFLMRTGHVVRVTIGFVID
jgi:hypothetical protein